MYELYDKNGKFLCYRMTKRIRNDKGERRQWRKQRTEAGAAVAECEGLLPPKHDAGTATRHYRAFWQRRCCAAAAGTVLKPLGGNYVVLPLPERSALL